MTQLFDAYENTYRAEVQSSIDFSGLSHDFFMSAKAELIQDLVKTRFPGENGPAALDIGCGVGTFHPFVRNSFGRLCGVDVSASCIDRARSENPNVDYKTYEGASLPYRDAEFEFAMAICVMHHVRPAEWISFLREMRRVTRPGGTLCVIEHNPLNPLTRLAVARCEFDRDATLLRSGVTEGLMAKAGLSDIKARFFLFFPSAARIVRSLERSIAWLPLGAQYAVCGRV
jgi:ubiquinone/menaquinone biosynthesis C-methylase UbiE